jgi:RNA polymerase sigma factor (sigma-70 family)
MNPEYYPNSPDDVLITNIKRAHEENDSLKELVNRHSGIYLDMINTYVPSNNIFTNKDELINDKEYNIYQAALKYDPSRGAKFSTYLGNETKWMCLNIYNKNKKHPEIATEEIHLELQSQPDGLTNQHDQSIKKELLRTVLDFIKEYPDERIEKIFTMRYVEGSKNKVMPWKSVSAELNMSIQGCINIHNSTIEKIKIKLKEI